MLRVLFMQQWFGLRVAHGHDRRAMAAALHERASPIVRGHGLEPVERPLDLLRGEIVLEDEQGGLLSKFIRRSTFEDRGLTRFEPGNAIVITVPRPGSLSTEMLPHS